MASERPRLLDRDHPCAVDRDGRYLSAARGQHPGGDGATHEVAIVTIS